MKSIVLLSIAVAAFMAMPARALVDAVDTQTVATRAQPSGSSTAPPADNARWYSSYGKKKKDKKEPCYKIVHQTIQKKKCPDGGTLQYKHVEDYYYEYVCVKYVEAGYHEVCRDKCRDVPYDCYEDYSYGRKELVGGGARATDGSRAYKKKKDKKKKEEVRTQVFFFFFFA